MRAADALLEPFRIAHAPAILSVINRTGKPRFVSGLGRLQMSRDRTAAKYAARASRNTLESCPKDSSRARSS